MKAQNPILRVVRKFLRQKGYIVTSLSIPHRHVVGHIKKNKTSFFFKMATHEAENNKIINEYKSDSLLKNKLKKSSVAIVRNHIENGFISFSDQKLSYFICEYVQGEDLSEANKETLQKAARLAHDISSVSRITLTLRRTDIGDCIYQSVSRLSKDLLLNNRKSLRFLARQRGKLQANFSHGDFTPWHLYKTDDRLTLIDTEHTGLNPKYYDVAHFYVRLRLNVAKKQSADQFLHEFIQLLSVDEQKVFWKEFKPVLIERITAQLWEVETKHPLGKGVRKSSCQRLLEDVLSMKSASLVEYKKYARN